MASFFIMAKVGMVAFAGVLGQGRGPTLGTGWALLLALVAALSMVLGNLAAIAQSSVRRLIGYSAVAHAGYALIGLLANQRADGMASVLYYATTYAVTLVGLFSGVAVVERASGSDRLEAFAGLGERSPGLAFCLMVFLLSLAGIPPLAGFFGKFFLFKAGMVAVREGTDGSPLRLVWLIALAVAMSAVSLYYYLQILKQVYVMRRPEHAPRLRATRGTMLVIGSLAALVVLVGCLPNLLLVPLQAAIQSSGF